MSIFERRCKHWTILSWCIFFACFRRRCLVRSAGFNIHNDGLGSHRSRSGFGHHHRRHSCSLQKVTWWYYLIITKQNSMIISSKNKFQKFIIKIRYYITVSLTSKGHLFLHLCTCKLAHIIKHHIFIKRQL